MMKLTTVVLTLALVSVAANAAFIDHDAPVALTEAQGATDANGNAPIDPTGLMQWTFYLNSEAGDVPNALWGATVRFASDTPGSLGIYNLANNGTASWANPVDTGASAAGTDASPFYSMAMDTWIAGDFALTSAVNPFIGPTGAPFTGWVPEIFVAVDNVARGAEGTSGERVPFIQIITDGDVKWFEGQISHTAEQWQVGTFAEGTSVPEPATMSLMLFGAIGMIARKRRRN